MYCPKISQEIVGIFADNSGQRIRYDAKHVCLSCKAATERQRVTPTTSWVDCGGGRLIVRRTHTASVGFAGAVVRCANVAERPRTLGRGRAVRIRIRYEAMRFATGTRRRQKKLLLRMCRRIRSHCAIRQRQCDSLPRC